MSGARTDRESSGLDLIVQYPCSVFWGRSQEHRLMFCRHDYEPPNKSYTKIVVISFYMGKKTVNYPDSNRILVHKINFNELRLSLTAMSLSPGTCLVILFQPTWAGTKQAMGDAACGVLSLPRRWLHGRMSMKRNFGSVRLWAPVALAIGSMASARGAHPLKPG
ncbi:MAG TPA: hypothetical protein PLD10_01020, partial [Rhodopila sp.]|nr:hypothetical protein [Rhodopila sp.]